LALALAASGSAFAAAALMKGDSLIKKQSLSGNRLRNHTITGTQINLGKLGKVPNAAAADVATNANHASNADSATNATNATKAANANQLGGVAPSGYEPAVHWALVDAGGTTIVAQSGGISMVSHPFVGEYILDFGFPVVGHPISVTPSGRDNAFVGSVWAAPCGTTSESYPNCATKPTNDVHVLIRATNNTTGLDHSFYVIVY
jgi:hypothetical protein